MTVNSFILNNYLSVYTEAIAYKSIDKAILQFEAHGITLDTYSYKHLIRMYVRVKDITSAMACKEEAINRGVALCGSTYGLLLESLTRRSMIVDAIKIFEESLDKKVTLPEKHLRFFRSRCKKLHVVHPDMPADPNLWVKEVRAERKRYRNTSDAKLERVRTAISFSG